jgi:hypothetical protein
MPVVCHLFQWKPSVAHSVWIKIHKRIISNEELSLHAQQYKWRFYLHVCICFNIFADVTSYNSALLIKELSRESRFLTGSTHCVNKVIWCRRHSDVGHISLEICERLAGKVKNYYLFYRLLWWWENFLRVLKSYLSLAHSFHFPIQKSFTNRAY